MLIKLFVIFVFVSHACVHATEEHAYLSSSPKVRQAQVWASLDIDTRRVLVERSKYIYRHGDVVVDAYFLLKWREELESLMARHTLHSTNKSGNLISKKVVGYEWRYLDDPEFKAYFELRTYGVHFWYGGCLVNDSSLWGTDEYQSLRKAAGVQRGYSKDDKVKVQEWVESSFPMVLVVDPVSQRDRDTDAYSKRRSDLFLKRGVLADPFCEQVLLPLPNQGVIDSWPGKLRRSSFGSVKLPKLIGDEMRNGVPKLSVDYFLLIPEPQVSNSTALGPASRSINGSTSVYRLEQSKRYQISAKELAVMWLDGQLEIPYREVSRQGSYYTCSEHLLERP